MNKEELKSEGILKEESVGYLKSALNLQQGTLVLTPKRIVLEAHKTTASGGGLLGAFLKKKVEENKLVFNIENAAMKSVVQGKHGVQKNVLEITDNLNNTHKIIVKDYAEWETAIKGR